MVKTRQLHESLPAINLFVAQESTGARPSGYMFV